MRSFTSLFLISMAAVAVLPYLGFSSAQPGAGRDDVQDNNVSLRKASGNPNYRTLARRSTQECNRECTCPYCKNGNN
ncbi:hypothetical protein IWQ62_005001 [Dispira parvispora]|uniref:Uncharacterized protein n=1 Tax=Dispira parvispora TaxID=1520584 RepID=A0A9W8AKU1_9FUNG|nr:hypothetical protein IWQ62_005001 [Dispira parvispora]